MKHSYMGSHQPGDGVRVQINASDVRWRVVEVEVSRVDTNDERTGRTEDVRQMKWTERNVWTLPMKREYDLQEKTTI